MKKKLNEYQKRFNKFSLSARAFFLCLKRFETYKKNFAIISFRLFVALSLVRNQLKLD